MTLQKQALNADLVVIGAGSGGLSVASGAAQFGLDVVLFEKGEMGGDCLNSGCVPSKALIHAARQAEAIRKAETYGIHADAPRVDWSEIKAHIKGVIETIAPVDSQERFEGMGVTVIREPARFASPDVIESDSVTVKARRIVIATGSTAFIPPIPGLEDTPFITNETIFDLPDFPEHLIILGGGPIGVEMAQAFAFLGAKVTLIERDRILARADVKHAQMAAAELRENGIALLEGHTAIGVEGTEGNINVSVQSGETNQTVSGTHLLVAVGRTPVMDGLALEKGGVAYDRQGIKTKANLRSVSNPKVWAVGDIAGRGQFTHLAGWHASVFVQNAFMKLRTKAASSPLPAVTYMEPELAQIGMTEDEAHAAYGDQITVTEFAFHENDRAIAERQTTGSVRIVIGKKDRILGASIFGNGAGDILQILSLAMSKGMKLRDLTGYISPYPTRAEVVKRAASQHYAPALFGKLMKTAVGILQKIP